MRTDNQTCQIGRENANWASFGAVGTLQFGFGALFATF